MDAFRFPSSPVVAPFRNRRFTRRQGLLAAAGASAGALMPAISSPIRAWAATDLQLVNPASRVLLPGEAGLSTFGLDFAISGPPAVFFSSGDTPGWSDDVKTSVDGFAFGYASMLSDSSNVQNGRAVQTCVHHGFSSRDDADIAWSSLIRALASGSRAKESATVQSLDLVEVIIVEGESILAKVAASGVNAIVLSSRSGTDLVTVAIADFTGSTPSADEALALAEAEGEKLQRSREISRRDLAGAFAGQWTPGFQLGSASGAPFFAWPTQVNNAPVAMSGESSAQFSLRQQSNLLVQHQSHIEGPFWEVNPLYATHALYYSAQSNFFASSGDAAGYHEQTAERLKASMLEVTVTKVKASKTERRYGYETQTSYGVLSGITLHKVISDGAFPLTLALHIIAVPFGSDGPKLDITDVIDRLDGTIREMRDGLEGCLVSPEQASLVVKVNVPTG